MTLQYTAPSPTERLWEGQFYRVLVRWDGGGSHGPGTGMLLMLQIAVPGAGSMHMPPLYYLELKCPEHAFHTALPSWECWAQPFCGGNSSPLCEVQDHLQASGN